MNKQLPNKKRFTQFEKLKYSLNKYKHERTALIMALHNFNLIEIYFLKHSKLINSAREKCNHYGIDHNVLIKWFVDNN